MVTGADPLVSNKFPLGRCVYQRSLALFEGVTAATNPKLAAAGGTMNATPLLFALLSTVAAFANDQIAVAVCNMAHVPEPGIARAEAEATYVFQAIGVEIRWADCTHLESKDSDMQTFIVRVRETASSDVAPPAGVDMMGLAYVAPDAPHVYADVYEQGGRAFAALYNAIATEILGYAIAHELGHLLIGPRHSPQGIMSAVWKAADVQAIRHRGLKFATAERLSIRRVLRGRADGAALARTRR